MEIFARIGETLEVEWRRDHYDERAFSALAHRALLTARLFETISPRAILDYSISARLPPRADAAGLFSDCPLTLYRSHRFYIDALFWFDGTTSIHGHAFSGAFAVLAGSSIHSTYSFRCDRRVSSQIRLGDLVLERVEMLRPGDCRMIIHSLPPEDGLVHGLFHLERPSVTIVARTFGEPAAQPQYRYLPPGIAIASRQEKEDQAALLAVLDCVAALDADAYAPSVAEALGTADFGTTILLLEQAVVGHRLSEESLRPLLASVRERHGSLAVHLPEALANERRMTAIADLRSQIHDEEHRFFLALLSNVPSRAAILDLVTARFEEEDPVDRILRWLGEITTSVDVGFQLDESAVEMLRHIFGGLTYDQIEARFAEEYEIDQPADALRELHDDLRSIDWLRPLFV